MKLKLLWAAFAAVLSCALWYQPAAAQNVTYIVSGVGEGSGGRASEYSGIPFMRTPFEAYFSFDPAEAVPYVDGYSYDFQGTDELGRKVASHVLVQNDFLYFDVNVDWRDTPGPQVDIFTLRALFKPGYLNGAFPTTIDYSQLVDIWFSGSTNYFWPHFDLLTSVGRPTAFRAVQNTNSNNPIGSVYIYGGVSAVPEPATWAMFILGFGILGYAKRRSIRVAAATSLHRPNQ